VIAVIDEVRRLGPLRSIAVGIDRFGRL
jgi:hypothetical protein